MHEPTSNPPESAAAVARNMRLGLGFFTVYLLFYAAFVITSAYRPDVMARGLFGVNVAVAWGLGLIVAAIVLAVLYMAVARPEGLDHPANSGSREARR